MINYNGKIITSTSDLLHENRAFAFGDAVFETVRIVNNRILFLEDHYFRLMASMRIIRMEIPMNFTLEYFEEQILLLAKANACNNAARARITVYRNSGGYYLPETNSVSFVIKVTSIDNKAYSIVKQTYEVDLYKDFHIAKHLISTIKSTNKLINVTASIYANENGLDSCILLNENKNIIEAMQGNIFMLVANKLITPPISEGCLNGVMRKQIIRLVKKMGVVEISEEIISPFDLQKADELFITNVIIGIQPITKYRKKEYQSILSKSLIQQMNMEEGLN